MIKTQWTQANLKNIFKKIKKPLTKAQQFWPILITKLDQYTQVAFRNEGARGGNAKWPDWNNGRGYSFKGSTTRTKKGTPKIRYGTDKNPKRTRKELAEYKTKNRLWYVSGPMKGYKGERRYSSNSKLLQASGGFRRSFGVMRTGRKKMIYGTNHELAKKIMSNPVRNVLFITTKDRKDLSRSWGNFVSGKMKI